MDEKVWDMDVKCGVKALELSVTLYIEGQILSNNNKTLANLSRQQPLLCYANNEIPNTWTIDEHSMQCWLEPICGNCNL
jgi:hypothetical protein